MAPELLARRDFIRYGLGVMAAVAIGDTLAACGSVAVRSASSTPLPPPETTTIRLNFSACDAPLMACEPYLRQEGFSDVQFSDVSPQLASLASGKADIAVPFVATLAAAVDSGKPYVGIGPLHPGCVELWAPQSVANLADLRGRTVVVNSKTPNFKASPTCSFSSAPVRWRSTPIPPTRAMSCSIKRWIPPGRARIAA